MNQSKRSLTFLWACLALLAGVSALQAERKPNVLFYLTDDLGYGDVGCYGAKGQDTPAIDQLAREGRANKMKLEKQPFIIATYSILVFVVFLPGVLSADAQESRLSEKQKSQLIKRFPNTDANKDGKLDDAELRALRDFLQAKRNTPASSGKPLADADADEWKTVGLQQANTMGGGEAAIAKGGKFRVFVLMGQSNMHGTGRANELKPPYTEKHDRIRIWANGRWEYLVPRQRFGPGVSFAHQLAIQGVRCDRSFANRGVFGQNYDAQYGDIDFTDGPHGLAGVFNPNSQMAVYGAGPHHYGDIISYALWMKTSSEEDMVLINTGRAGLRGLMNLNLNDGDAELLMAGNARLIAKGQKLNDGGWHHIAVSMPKKDCKLSEVPFYVDGQPVESRVVGQDKPISISMVNKLSFGGLKHGAGKTPFSKLIHIELGIKPFEGSLDEISVWSRALTATEVAELAR